MVLENIILFNKNKLWSKTHITWYFACSVNFLIFKYVRVADISILMHKKSYDCYIIIWLYNSIIRVYKNKTISSSVTNKILRSDVVVRNVEITTKHKNTLYPPLRVLQLHTIDSCDIHGLIHTIMIALNTGYCAYYLV